MAVAVDDYQGGSWRHHFEYVWKMGENETSEMSQTAVDDTLPTASSSSETSEEAGTGSSRN